jgi:membrane associated rhomboid family serine protease
MSEDISQAGRAGGPIFNVPWPVMTLVILLAAIHAMRWLAGEDTYLWSLAVFAFVPAQFTGQWLASLPGAQVWSFLSYAFIHGDWMHLLFNGLWMIVFGSVVARRLGPARFFAHAAAGAIAAALASLIMHWGETVFVVGASGAISGQFAAAIPLMYANGLTPSTAMRTDLTALTPLGPLELLGNQRALLFIAIWFVITLYTGVTGMAAPGEPQAIAWEAHIGGFFGGLAAFYLLDRRAGRPA